MTKYESLDDRWIDGQGIALMVVVGILAVALGSAAIWIGLH